MLISVSANCFFKARTIDYKEVSLFPINFIIVVSRGAKETATFCRFWRFLASVARDCKRDIYSRFLHLARHTSPSLLITSLIYVILQHLIIYISVACLRSAFAL